MLIITERGLRDFDAWSDGKDRQQRLMELENESKIDLSEIEKYIEELYPEGTDETMLNDFLWFDLDDAFQSI